MLKKFYQPQSIAIIGASQEKRKVGYEIFNNLIQGKFPGKLYPINPKANEILGFKCFPKISDVPHPIDLAIIIIPSKFISNVVKECGEKGIKSLIIISAGFKETGEAGANLEKEVYQVAKQYNIRILGPNCLGLIDPYNNLNASFATDMPDKGTIAFMSQSGALCTAILDLALMEKIGFSKFISLGNKMDLTETDFFKVLKEDNKTKVILCYLEGVNNGDLFIKEAKEASLKKPIIVIKAGQTAAGMRAVSSHTGTLAGRDQSYETAFKQCGITRAFYIEELLDYAIAFANQPLPQGNRVAVLTNAGGPGIMTVDACEKIGLQVASLEKITIDALKGKLPAASNFYNPVDLLGDARSSLYEEAIKILLEDKNVDILLVLLTPQAMTDISEIAHKIAKYSPNKKPILTCFMGGLKITPGREILRKSGIPTYTSPEKAVKAIHKMWQYNKWLKKSKEEKIFSFKVNKEELKHILVTARKEKRRTLTDLEGMKIIEKYGIKVPYSKLATTVQEAKEIILQIGFPAVLKISSPDILHKSDVGGIKVIQTEEEITNAYEIIINQAKKYKQDAKILGILIQSYIPFGKEIIIGISKDPQFGSFVMSGLGGVYVEVLRDVSFRMTPLTKEDAEEMIQEIKAFPLLKGVRGEKGVNIEAIVDCLLKVAQLSLDLPEILEIDLNPLKVAEECIALDWKFIIKE